MSGFCGAIRLDGGPLSSSEGWERAAAWLRVRGEGDAVFHEGADGAACLARTGGELVRDARYTLLGDIRLDARAELEERLERSGERVEPGASCTQLVLRAWQLWGEAALEDLLGDFSFAIWDAVERVLWCARDFTGARPFFYARTGAEFYFSNTLQVLRALPGVSRALDERFVGEFLLQGYCGDAERTVYAGIRRLRAGFRLKVDADSCTSRRFTSLPIEEPLRLQSAADYVAGYREVTRRAVEDRLPRGHAALYLSGGVDSGTVCALAVAIARERGDASGLKAFTGSWAAQFEDPEPKFAAETAQRLELAQEILGDAVTEPFADPEPPAIVPPEPVSEAFYERTLRQYRRIAEHAPVVLSGDGGDDVLTGQAWPYLTFLARRGEWWRLAREFGGFAAAHGKLPPLLGGFRTRVRRWIGGGDSEETLPAWLRPEFAERAGLREPDAAPERDAAGHPVHPRAYATLQSGVWAAALEAEDAGATGVTLETRAPLLDLRVLRYLFRLPTVPWCVEKSLAREAMVGALPESVLRRPKAPLAEDPLEIFEKNGTLRRRIQGPFAEEIQRFVDTQKWRATLEISEGCTSRENLYPFFLSRWLLAIENGKGIQ